MSYIEVNNFKSGLDVRRSEMTTAPGALSVAVNGFINEGGEFEKRRAFVPYSLPANTFGFAPTSTGFMVFGSVATPLGFPMTLWVGGPVVQYARIQHPDGATAMTGIRSVTPFGGDLIVVAEFGADVYAYTVSGTTATIIADFIAGLVLAYYISGGGGSATTQSNIAAALAAIVTPPYSGTHTGSNTYLDFFGNGQNDYALAPTVDAASTATITKAFQASATPGAAATSAVGQFTITHGNTGGQITSIKVNTDECLSATINWTTNAALTAAAVAANINANGASLYDAVANGSTITLTKTATGATVNGYDVIVTSAGPMCVGNCSMSLVGPAFTLSSVNANGVELLSTSLTYPGAYTGLDDFLSNALSGVVANINAGTGTHGYVAACLSNFLFVAKAVTSSADTPITVLATVTPTSPENGSGVGSGIESPLTVAVAPSAVSIEIPAFISGTDYTTQVTATVTGGAAPYTYQWRMTSFTDKLGGLSYGGPPAIVSPTAAATRFSHYKPSHTSYFVVATFVCDVRDSLGATITSLDVTVTMRNL